MRWPERAACAGAAALLLALAGCRDPRAVQAAEATRLLDADRAFALQSNRDGAAAAFFNVTTEASMVLPANDPPALGREAIRDRLVKLPPQVLDWTPMRAEVAKGLDLGWTWGEWRLLDDAASRHIVARGKYLNVWKRDGDGRWKLMVDLGNEAAQLAPGLPITPPAAEPQPAAAPAAVSAGPAPR